jgi:hypothetical protein
MAKKVKPREFPLPPGKAWGEGDSNRALLSLYTVRIEKIEVIEKVLGVFKETV